MDFFKDLFDSFIPHKENAYKPHFLRLKSVLIMMIAVVVLGIGAIVLQRVIIEKSDYLAAVISSTIINLANADRGSNNLAYLSENPLLDRAAQMKADDMAKNSYFAHTSPAGVTPWHWFKEAGYAFVYAGENLAVRFSDSVDVERAWMNSPTHRANILNSHFTEIGVGVAQGMYEGQPTVFVVQEFGSPSAQASYPSFLTSSSTLPATTTVASVKPKAKPAATSAVASANVKGAEIVETPPTVIQEDPTFIAVKNEVATNSPLSASPESPKSAGSLTEKIITSPKSVVATIYLVLAAIIGIALIIMIGIEFSHQHPTNVALGVLLILLMVGLLYLGQVLVPGSLVVL